jgi:hypothetical protein
VPTIAPDSIRHAAGGVLGNADASLNRQPVKSRPLNSGTNPVAGSTALDPTSSAKADEKADEEADERSGNNPVEQLTTNTNEAAANRRPANPKRMEGFLSC